MGLTWPCDEDGMGGLEAWVDGMDCVDSVDGVESIDGLGSKEGLMNAQGMDGFMITHGRLDGFMITHGLDGERRSEEEPILVGGVTALRVAYSYARLADLGITLRATYSYVHRAAPGFMITHGLDGERRSEEEPILVGGVTALRVAYSYARLADLGITLRATYSYVHRAAPGFMITHGLEGERRSEEEPILATATGFAHGAASGKWGRRVWAARRATVSLESRVFVHLCFLDFRVRVLKAWLQVLFLFDVVLGLESGEAENLRVGSPSFRGGVKPCMK